MKKLLDWFNGNAREFGLVFFVPFALGISVALLYVVDLMSFWQLLAFVIVTGVCYAGMDYMVKAYPCIVEKLKAHKLTAKYSLSPYEKYGKLFLALTAICLGLLLMWIGPLTISHISVIASFSLFLLLASAFYHSFL